MNDYKYNLFLDDSRELERVTWMTFPDGDWRSVKNYDEFVKIIEDLGPPEFISFDFDLHDSHYKAGAKSQYQICDYEDLPHKTGLACARWLLEYCKKRGDAIPSFQCHSLNPGGRREITKLLTSE